MFEFLFGRPWISQEVIDYLNTIPRMFRIYYVVSEHGQDCRFLMRDEDMVWATFDRNERRRVTSICIQFQEDGFSEYYFLDKSRIDAGNVPYIKEKFDSFIKKYPKTHSKIKANSLYETQRKLRHEVERVTGVIGAYDGKDIVINLNGISEESRCRVLDVVKRFGKDCLATTLMITLAGATDEEIGATLSELAMVEAVDESANEPETELFE